MQGCFESNLLYNHNLMPHFTAVTSRCLGSVRVTTQHVCPREALPSNLHLKPSPVQSHLTGKPNPLGQGHTEHRLEKRSDISFPQVSREFWDCNFFPNEVILGVCALKSWLYSLALPLNVVLRAYRFIMCFAA